MNDKLSYFSQYDLCKVDAPGDPSVYLQPHCRGQNYYNASIVENFITSNNILEHAPKKNSTLGQPEEDQYGQYSLCVYEVYNPYPNQTLYLNVYRQTNYLHLGVEFLQQKELLALQDDKPILETFGDVKLMSQLNDEYEHMYEENEASAGAANNRTSTSEVKAV